MAPTRLEPNHNNSVPCIKKTWSENGVEITRYFCPICNDSVGRKSDFLRHMERHTGGRLHYCREPGCEHPWGFAQLGNLRSHHRAVHERKRYSCPHFWVDANGNISACDHTYSDQSGLIRHRSAKHGFEPGHDEALIKEATPVGKKFPNSKYVRGSKRQANGDDMARLPTHRPKRSKPTPTSSCSAPYPSLSGSSHRSSRTKATSAGSAVKLEEKIDWSSLHTLPNDQPSEVRPVTVSDWDLGFGCLPNEQLYMQSQPAAGTSFVDPPSLPSYITRPVQPGNLEALFNAEPRTAVVNNWTFGPQMADFDFTFTAAPLPVPAINDAIDPSMLMIPAPTMSPKLEQVTMANAGLASSPYFYGPGQGTDWGSHPSPWSSRESTASPDFNMFAGMPSPSDPSFNEYYGL
ncbi:hypothetical protein LXA43DRAFT_352498 [Ganoderma leucocontextum]|nr:hypothetical protein LXA43DRAFT_352498 [Ganoderma leucocontextum]